MWDLALAPPGLNITYLNFITFRAYFIKYLPGKDQMHKIALMKPYISKIKPLIREKNKVQREDAKSPITFGEFSRRSRNQGTVKDS